MQNPNHAPTIYPVVSPARLNAIEGLTRAFLAAQAARSDIADDELVALAVEFAQTPGTLKLIKDRIGLA